MKKLLVLLICLSECGCETMQRHPYVTRFVEGSLLLSAVGAVAYHNHGENATRNVGQPEICDIKPEACR